LANSARLNIVRVYTGILFLSTLLSSCAFSPKIKTLSTASDKEQKQNVEIILPQEQLPVYEKLTYKVRWLGITVGTLTTSIQGTKEYKDRDVYVLEATMQTNAFLSKIYSIEDRFISYMDVEKKYTLCHQVHRSDGGYKKDAITEFDQVNHRAHFKSFTDRTEKDFDIPEGVHDILSAYYYFMLLPLSVGDSVEYQICNNEQNYKFFGHIQSKVSLVLPALDKKKREAFRMQPYAKLKGQKVDKGTVEAYFSCEKRRRPLYMVMKGPIFTEVTVTLVKIEN
jgi:hypothetical protein